MAKKYIVVTGGVLSGIGKGIVSASIGRILKDAGIKVNSLKIDPYLNVDAGTMNPNQHGEVFVTEDGYEADLDLGHYERFLGIDMKRFNNITAGQIFKSIIEKEREGKYLGATVQMVPHVTEEIKNRIKSIDADLLMIEIGGTVGDIEGEIFLESVRELSLEEGIENFFFIHVTFVPYLRVTNEFKTKPTQQSVQLLRKIGIHPNMLIIRTEKTIDSPSLDKIALFAGIDRKYVINLPDADNVYEVPEKLYYMGIQKIIAEKLNLKIKDTLNWNYPKTFAPIKIAMVGKYLGTDDAYKSIIESIFLSGAEKPELIDSQILEELSEEEAKELLLKYDGIIIPGGFGKRGIEGKIKAVKIARENKIPLFGICLGMQIIVIEFARNVGNLENANSSEFNPETPYPVIDIMEEQKKVLKLGGTMRLGAQDTKVFKNTRLYEIYKKENISERHRHRYEVNLEKFKELFAYPDEENKENKLIISSKSEFVEAVEIENHPFFIGVQYHPELKSKVGVPHPIFKSFVETIIKLKEK
ncbi:CTP synthetase [Marinitoga sp. 1135]|uniref:CTP synthase n=1 Tax=Marinitoga piezophila (strain DSM 14283 / JCM 11233 / KA3) TaxID=443254 RepID=H2J628_MARPK|nr:MULTISPECIES: CTP synthase [Marinitoga]AEX85089.1 CTP synthase [Marinitoga piezophila KA3]APT75594.1 CTP synthetase [Marinitoga sp. 1137]NUU95303.1 CTP synthetase [Marinitoga sp. 1135]NUU97237.1 CTP synthetase [Marinitoga sp. 1138]